ncbi:hypothetical protein POP15_162 [Pectobacterium phage POP15]|nr:hypothetical protein POP15_162 [Pectobacterium phage POP15]
MITIITMIGLAAAGLYCLATQKRWAWNRAQKVYGYFEYEYKGEKGSSRDYGAMLEIDMVGAMQYRQELGAAITFEVYKSNPEEIDDIIDQRYYMEQQQTKRRR